MHRNFRTGQTFVFIFYDTTLTARKGARLFMCFAFSAVITRLNDFPDWGARTSFDKSIQDALYNSPTGIMSDKMNMFFIVRLNGKFLSIRTF